MSVPVCCPHCRAQCLFGDEFLGRTVQCLYCGKQMQLPGPVKKAVKAPAKAPVPSPAKRPVPVQAHGVRPPTTPLPVQPPRGAPVLPPAPVPVTPLPVSPLPGTPGVPQTPLPLRIARVFWKGLRFLVVVLCVGLFRLGRWLYAHPRVTLPGLGIVGIVVLTLLISNALRGPRGGHGNELDGLGWEAPPDGKSPAPDGKVPETAGKLFTLPEERVCSAVFSQDGKTLYTGSQDGALKSWVLATGKAQLVLQRDRKIAALAISPKDGSLAVATAGDLGWKSVQLVDPTAAKQPPPLPWPEFRDFESPDGHLVFSADGARLLAVGRHRAIAWDTATAKIVAVNQFQLTFARTVAPAHDGKTLAGATYPGITIYELVDGPYEPGKPIPEPIPRKRLGQGEGEDYDIFALSFGPDGRLAGRASRVLKPDEDASKAHDVVILSEVKGKWLRCPEPKADHDADVRMWLIPTATLAYSGDGKRVVSGGLGWLGMWDADTGQLLASMADPSIQAGAPSGWGEPVGMTFAPDGRTVASVWVDGRVRLWRPRGGS